MPNRAIGIFDSGIGGLTVANAVSRSLPNEQIIYLGDTAHFPYGEKSVDALQQYALGIADFLVKENCKAIVIACNTASAVAAELVQEACKEIPVINVIDPLISEIANSGLAHIGILGTKPTIDSGLYQNRISAINPDLLVSAKATRALASIIEEELHESTSLIQAIINHYCKDDAFQSIDGLVLACTHYPIIANEFAHYYKGAVRVFDHPTIVAETLVAKLKELDLLAQQKQTDHRFLVTDYTTNFQKTTKLFFRAPIQLELKDLWKNRDLQ